MNQPDLFSISPPVAHYRRTDPATSRDAAQTVRSSELMARVETWMLSRGTRGGNSLEMAEDTGLDRVTLSPRFKPLEQAGVLIRTDERRGRSQVWVHRKYWRQA